MNFFNKEFRKISLENIDKSNMFWAWIGSFLGIIAISYFHMDILDDKDLTLVVGSFGASAVLIYGVPNSPLSQPRNLIGGHLLSAIVGVVSYKLFSSNLFLATAIAVSTSILIMQLTLTLHPPGGATSLIAVIGGEQIHELEFFYILIPDPATSAGRQVDGYSINN